MNGLTLSLDTFGVAINRPYVVTHERRVVFLDGSDDAGVVEYSAAGTSRIQGSPSRYLWNVQVFLTQEQLDALKALYSRQRKLEAQRQSFGALLFDFIESEVDDGARERAIAPGTQESSVPGGAVAYFAQFWVRVGAPKSTPVQNPNYPWRVEFSMSELEVVAP